MENQKIKYFLDNRNFSRKKTLPTQESKKEILGVVDGKIVVDTNSEEDNGIITSFTYLTKKNKNKRWTKEESELFYKSLECCGCEFSMINILFPNRSRNNLKDKFKKEMKINKARVDNALNNFNKFDLEKLMKLKDVNFYQSR